MNNKPNFCDMLKLKGLKVTKHRNSVLEIIESSNQPISAEDIYILLKQKNISINLSSIYRILDTLVANSLINKFIFEENNKTCYEINTMDHKHYLICSNCKRMLPISGCPLESYEAELEKSLGFTITNHRLEIYGYCKECKELKDEYQKMYGPLTINYPCNKWRWLEQPWPWERGNY